LLIRDQKSCLWFNIYICIYIYMYDYIVSLTSQALIQMLSLKPPHVSVAPQEPILRMKPFIAQIVIVASIALVLHQCAPIVLLVMWLSKKNHQPVYHVLRVSTVSQPQIAAPVLEVDFRAQLGSRNAQTAAPVL
jgi:hypothetical protein